MTCHDDLAVGPDALATFFESLMPALDERQRRLLAGATARMLGGSTLTRVAAAAGMSRATVNAGMADIDRGDIYPGRARAPGGGRKKLVEWQPALLDALDGLIEPAHAGSSALFRWTDLSLAQLAKSLEKLGFWISADSLGRLLKSLGYRLRAPLVSTPTDPRAFLCRLSEEAKGHAGADEPVVSVCITQRPIEEAGAVETGPVAQAAGESIYDLGTAPGWGPVEADDPVACAFAGRALRRWWETMGRDRHPGAHRALVVVPDGAPVRCRRWPSELDRFAVESGLATTVRNLPAVTFKWSRLEHRLSSFVVTGRPSHPEVSYRATVELVGSAEGPGLQERAELHRDRYDGSERPNGNAPSKNTAGAVAGNS
ncbi:MAG TPA: hypothetical protein VHT75_18920 [Acidimicrobiales bacterium]|jgi:hypothetical protein|nr:hypothetical protein [Acidimicrobiales bacterium]